MTPEEKKQQVLRHDGKVFNAVGIEIVAAYIDPAYTLAICNPAQLEPTGLLKIFTLESSSSPDPQFIGRWDGGSRDEGKTQRQDLDIDIEQVSETTKRHFKRRKNGYSGHHSERTPDTTERRYDVDIAVPGRKIFQGTVKFVVHRKLALLATTTPVVSISRTIQRRTDK